MTGSKCPLVARENFCLIRGRRAGTDAAMIAVTVSVVIHMVRLWPLSAGKLVDRIGSGSGYVGLTEVVIA